MSDRLTRVRDEAAHDPLEPPTLRAVPDGGGVATEPFRPVAPAAPVADVVAPAAEPAVVATEVTAREESDDAVERALDARRAMDRNTDGLTIIEVAEPALVPELVGRMPKQAFTIQIARALDDLLRAEALRRTRERGQPVNKTDFIVGAFVAHRIPADASAADALVARLPLNMVDVPTVIMSVRIDAETRSRLAVVRMQLKQMRSPTPMNEVYTALIVGHLGGLAKKAQR